MLKIPKELILERFHSIINKYNLFIKEDSEKILVLSNNDLSLRFINQNFDGIDLFYEKDGKKIKIDFFVRCFCNEKNVFIEKSMLESNNRISFIIDYLKETILLDNEFILENNIKKIEKFKNWKSHNKEKIYDKLLENIRNKKDKNKNE
jgi:hypothetical protein